MTITMFIDMIPAVRKAKDAVKGLRDSVADTGECICTFSYAACLLFKHTHIQKVA